MQLALTNLTARGDWRTLPESKLRQLEDWLEWYSTKYPCVGQVSELYELGKDK